MTLADAIEQSAAPRAAALAVDQLIAADPTAAERLNDPLLARAVATVTGASRAFSTLLVFDPGALHVLGDLDHRSPPVSTSIEDLRRWKRLEELRIAARDLLGLDDVEAATRAIAQCARDVLTASLALAQPAEPLAVIGMGKLGGDELNYASDIDVMFVGQGDPGALERAARRTMEATRPSFRIDANLRPQGRDGPLVRSIASYQAYWERWAEPWEMQALLKARFAAGAESLGREFEAVAEQRLWSTTFSADDLRQLRHMKARTEADLARRGLTDREVKLGRGGIRDIEFAVQLLQLVHGRLDEDLRSPTTLTALSVLAEAGYVDGGDAAALAEAYRFLRMLEHRLQLYDGAQVHAMPVDDGERTRIARTMGFADGRAGSALEQLDAALARHQGTVRTIHERLYFRPLLEAFAGADDELLHRPGAIEARLAAFGFSDGPRTRAAVHELTRGLTRSSRLMQQMLPVLLSWLSTTPDPDLGLLCLRNLSDQRDRAEELARAFRDSPEAARRLCSLVGTSRMTADLLARNIDLVARLPDSGRLSTQARPELVSRARTALDWRPDLADRQRALRRWKDRNLFGIVARDLLGAATTDEVGRDLTTLAEASLEAALAALDPAVPFAVIALGRFAGSELSYASDLDVVFVYEGSGAADRAEADRVASGLRRFVDGASPAEQIWNIDLGLRPEGKQGPISRSLSSYDRYFEQWALVWERQAMLRARPVAGDAALGVAFMALLDGFVWEPGLSADDRREIRRMKARIERERLQPGDDPQFHLKLGRGALVDVEFTAQLLQLEHGIREPSTTAALRALVEHDALDPHDGLALGESYRFCERTRNRMFLVRSAPGDALPQQGAPLTWLARSLDTTPAELREEYRRVTRRARAVVERVFYGIT